MKGTSLGATVHYFTTRLLNGIQKQEKIKPYKVSSIQSVPSHIIRPSYVGSISNPAIVKDPEVHDDTGIHHMRNAGRLAASALEYARSLVKPGITTDEIDKAVHKMIIGAGAYPSPLGYKGFPKSICTSVNEVAFHGIPDLRPLEDGDIINIDVTIYLNGYHADTSKTFLCGNVNNNAMQLVEVTEDCLEKAISVCGPGVEFKELGKIFIDIAGKYGYSVDTSYAGHGIGKHFHSAPCINFCEDQAGCMMAGQTFALEPLLSLGSIEYELWDDNYTFVTADGSLSAQFEHTLLITKTGVEILTKLS
ncbi:hypothetical protein SUGI_0068340 [Cryptomeria japonica]|uniref:methionine aminopeptidase 1D, chloroplastic/mitochondrial isoform X2 n=1 Tax=Cryptomeria japonica TaxID=3369 RepID=UPI002408AEE4|nr:methionine aminopeptidase 1D, chloroplastic/mitochondrial isoform X2 [Cryptomeria japonica]GLJ07499.1 hypothetical protein SUGI_0068340 [Cryptomeria japonica]